MEGTEVLPVLIKASRFGRGLFASTKLTANTFICRITGSYLKFADTILLKERESHCLQIGADVYIFCTPPFLYSNHSCAPNCAISADLYFYTLTDIDEGEELFWDYSTSMLEKHWTMECCCGSTNCRKFITDFDLLPEQLQQEYVSKNIVLPYIIQEIKNRKDIIVNNVNNKFL